MFKAIHDFFIITPEVKPEFLAAAQRHNRLSLLVICVMIFGMELFNMARVLFWSASGLGTLNNRIYFAFYSSLFLAAALYLLLAWLLRRRAPGVKLALQYACAAFCLVWHVCMNAYDILAGHSLETGIYLTAVLGMGVFILMPAWLSFALHGAAYLLFMALAAPSLDSGQLINLSFASIVALAASLTNCRHHAVVIAQRQEIRSINERLQVLVQRDPLTGLLNKTAFQRCVEPHLGERGAALLILDLDDFKSVNDRFGHPCGDFVLKETAILLDAAFTGAAGVSRIGGDEFAVLTLGLSAQELEDAARTLIRSVSAITWRGQAVSSGCSIGGCRLGSRAISYEQLYDAADRALYRAKEHGKEQFYLLDLP